MDFGKLLKEARLSAGLTQKELGDKLGISASMVGQYETGYRNPKTETIVRFANALGKNFYDLVDISEISPSLNTAFPIMNSLLKFLDDKKNKKDVILSAEDKEQFLSLAALLRKSQDEFKESEFVLDSMKDLYVGYFDNLNFEGKRLALEAVRNIYQDPENREN